MTLAVPTRDRLLDAAERLFAEHGLDGTSLRRITAAADANLAAVNYHFGSKLELVRAVFERRLAPMNAERLRLLDEAVAAAAPAPPDLRAVLHAFLAPALSLGRQDGREFFVLIARAHSTPHAAVQEVIVEQFGDVIARFRGALQGAQPDVPLPELFWRVHFTIGALCHTVVNSDLLRLASRGLCDDTEEAEVLERLLDYAVAGVSGGRAS